MTRTRVKFCGLTQAADVDFACGLGVDAIGLVLVPASARFLKLSHARSLRDRLDANTRSVLLFLDPTADAVRRAIDVIEPDLLQFHGTEDQVFCQQFGVPWIKALSEAVADTEMASHSGACKLLIDSHLPGALGGTGQSIDAARFPGDSGGSRWVLAGGLNPENVADSVIQLRPFAVDVSSGIESTPGIKDAEKMTAFMTQVRRADER
ncbi:MAG: N-(5'-phosphoribosyl)anthranilate isomerase [Lysobacterales bacterium]